LHAGKAIPEHAEKYQGYACFHPMLRPEIIVQREIGGKKIK
jgi:hypothetical protein